MPRHDDGLAELHGRHATVPAATSDVGSGAGPQTRALRPAAAVMLEEQKPWADGLYQRTHCSGPAAGKLRARCVTSKNGER